MSISNIISAKLVAIYALFWGKILKEIFALYKEIDILFLVNETNNTNCRFFVFLLFFLLIFIGYSSSSTLNTGRLVGRSLGHSSCHTELQTSPKAQNKNGDHLSAIYRLV